MGKVAIVGVGWEGFKPSVPELSFREMMFEAALRAYEDAGLDPRSDVDAFISCQEDYWEGIAITDEFAPEPIGGVLRPTMTVAGDAIQGLIQAYMMINTGFFDVVVVESHAKPSDIAEVQKIYELALDPLYVRPLNIANPFFTAGLDAIAFMDRTGTPREALAMVAVKNKLNGLYNPRAPHAARITLDEVLSSSEVVSPLTSYEIAPLTDAAIVFVIASEDTARKLSDNPIWIEGVGWNTEVGTGSIEYHVWGSMPSMKMAASMAYSMAGISNPARETDFAEVEDRFSFMELLALEEAGIAGEGEAWTMLEKGDLERGSFYPVNPSGGSLAIGTPLEATGGARVLEAVIALREAALDLDREKALVLSWRGPPTYTSMAVILSL